MKLLYFGIAKNEAASFYKWSTKPKACCIATNHQHKSPSTTSTATTTTTWKKLVLITKYRKLLQNSNSCNYGSLACPPQPNKASS
jgi:hypothetical protein